MSIVRVVCPHCKSSSHLENLMDGAGWNVIHNIGCEHLYVEQESYGFTILAHDIPTSLVEDPADLVVVLRDNLLKAQRLLVNLRLECTYRNLAMNAELNLVENYQNLYTNELNAFENALKA